MTSKEKIEKAWELVNSKHIETNEEIQLVRYAVRIARNLVEREELFTEMDGISLYKYYKDKEIKEKENDKKIKN